MPPCNVVLWLAWRARGEERGDREEAFVVKATFVSYLPGMQDLQSVVRPVCELY